MCCTTAYVCECYHARVQIPLIRNMSALSYYVENETTGSTSLHEYLSLSRMELTWSALPEQLDGPRYRCEIIQNTFRGWRN
jgi:hypothetical protein